MKKATLLSVLSLALLIVSCGKDRTREEQVSAMITKVESPILIMSMTPQNILDKSGIRDGVLPFTYDMLLTFFIDETVTGIDYSVKSQIVVGKGESFQPSVYAIFKLKDEKKFIELLETEANATVVEKEGMKTAIKESDNYAVVWNEEFAIMSTIPIDIMAMLSGQGGGGGDKAVNKMIEMIKAGKDAEPNQTYTDFLNKAADISLFYDGKGMYAYMHELMAEDAEELEKARETYEGITSEIFINFTNGSIDFEIINHLTDQVREKFNFMKEKGIEGKLLSYANSATPFFSGAYNMDFAGMADFIKSQMSDDFYSDFEEELALMGLSVDDLKESVTGEFIYFIDRVEVFEVVEDFGYGDPYTYTETMPVFGFAFTVKNPEPLMVLLADSLKLPNGTYGIEDTWISLNNGVFFVSNDSAWTNKAHNGQTVTITKGAEVLAANPFSMFVNFSAMAEAKGMDEAAALLKVFTEFSGGATIDGGKFNFVMADDSKNSLRIITEVVAAELERLEKEGGEAIEAELNEAVLESETDTTELEF